MKSPISFLVLTAGIAFADPSIQRATLDDRVVVSVPVATNRVTTLNFPGPIAAIDAAGVTADPKVPGQFQLAHTKGASFLSVRALARKGATNLNIRWNKRTYVFELFESDAPLLSLNLEAPPQPAVAPAPEIGPTRLLALLDKAKAFPLLKQQHPESVADVDFTTYDAKPLVSDFDDYEIRIEEAFRFNPEDTLVFRVVVTNKTDAPLRYWPDSFAVRAGNRLYHQSISDASGAVPPLGSSIVYFAITGTPDGGRNELSLKNAFTVLVERMAAKRSPQTAVQPAPVQSPARLRSLIDEARAFPMLKRHHPEVVADVEVVAYADHATDFNDYEVRLDEGYHFSRDDTLVLRATLKNKKARPITCQGFALRAGNRVYPQSASDAPGVISPNGESTIYFAVTGTPDLWRDEQNSVLVERTTADK